MECLIIEKITKISRDFIIHPGESLQEFLKDRKMSQKELAIRYGVSEKHVSTVLNGKKDNLLLMSKNVRINGESL